MHPHEKMTPTKVLNIIHLGGSPPADPHLYTDVQLWLLVKQYTKAKDSLLQAIEAILGKARSDIPT